MKEYRELILNEIKMLEEDRKNLYIEQSILSGKIDLLFTLQGNLETRLAITDKIVESKKEYV